MTYTLPNQISNGDAFDAVPVQGNFDSIENELNSIDGANIDALSIPDGAMVNNPESIRDETMYDGVVSGLTTADPGATLTATIAAGIAYINGKKVSTNSYGHTYTASKDCYVDLDDNGTFHVTEVANGATSPAVYTNSLRIAKYVTNATEVTSATIQGRDSIGTIIRKPLLLNYATDNYKFAAYRSAAANMSSNTWTTMNCDAEDFDLNNNHAAGIYTAPVTGYYVFHCQAQLTVGTGGLTAAGITLVKSDSSQPVYVIQRSASGLSSVDLNGGCMVHMTAGQTMTFQVYADGAGQASYAGGTTRLTRFDGHLLSV